MTHAHPAIDSNAAFTQARDLLRQQHFAEARRVLDEAIARAPQELPLRVLLSHAYLQEGRDWDAAEKALREVLRLEPHFDEAWRNLVRLLRLRRRTAEAFAACQAGLTQCPDCDELALLEGMILHERRDYRGAEERFLRFLERQTGRPPDEALRWTARHGLALSYREQGRYVEAEALWQALLAGQPERAVVWGELGDLYLRQGRLLEADEALRRLAADPAEASLAQLLRARIHLARREFAAARAAVEPLIAADPQALPPRVVLSYIHLQAGTDPAAAEKALRDVLALDTNNAEARSNLEVLLAQRG